MKMILKLGIAYLAGILTLLAPVWVMVSRPAAGVERGIYTPRLTLSAEAVDERRARLTAFLFGDDTLPNARPEGDAIPLPNGLSSTLRWLEPEAPNGAAAIYHSGHLGMIETDWNAANALAEAGVLVAVLDMPLIGVNAPPALEIPHLGRVTLREHAQLEHLDAITNGSPLRYFIEPVIVTVNELAARGYERIYMVGLSGGGWTTTLAAALDPRIAASYPIAGSIPLGARWTGPDLYTMDWEQYAPALYSLATYEDLYLMGAHGRRQVQILNERDDCCFADPRYPQWEHAVTDALGDAGVFRVLWDTTAVKHEISAWALEAILADMARR